MKDKRGVLGLNLVGAVILTLLVIAVMIIAMFLVFTSVIPTIATVETAASGVMAGTPQYLVPVNSTTGTLTYCDTHNGVLVTNATVVTANATLSSTNYTLSACKITAVAGSGWKNEGWNITAYTFTYKQSAQSAEDMQNNITTGTVNFIKQVPTIMTILGVIVLILAIAIIIVSVRRFSGGTGESFGGSSRESSYQL